MSQKIRIKLKSYDHNLVDKSAEKIVKTVGDWCYRKWPHTPAHSQENLHSKPFYLRQQEEPRTV